MSLILFFGFAAILVTFSTVYVTVVIHHHYKLSKLGKKFEPSNRITAEDAKA